MTAGSTLDLFSGASAAASVSELLPLCLPTAAFRNAKIPPPFILDIAAA